MESIRTSSQRSLRVGLASDKQHSLSSAQLGVRISIGVPALRHDMPGQTISKPDGRREEVHLNKSRVSGLLLPDTEKPQPFIHLTERVLLPLLRSPISECRRLLDKEPYARWPVAVFPLFRRLDQASQPRRSQYARKAPFNIWFLERFRRLPGSLRVR